MAYSREVKETQDQGGSWDQNEARGSKGAGIAQGMHGLESHPGSDTAMACDKSANALACPAPQALHL